MPDMRDSSVGRPAVTRAAFAQVPIELLDACVHRKGAVMVYLRLWHYAGQNDAAWPSNQRLAADCGMSEDDTRKAKKWLSDHGWIERIARPGMTDLFHVRFERCTPPSNGTPPPNGGVPQMGEYTPPPNGTPNKNHLTKTSSREETPLNPPVGGEAPQAAPNGWASPGQLAQQPGQQPQAAQVPAAVTSPSSSALVVHPVEVLPPAGSASIDPAAAIWPQEAQQGASIASAAHSPAEQPAGPMAGRTAPDPDRSGAETPKPRKPSKPRDPFSSRQLPPNSIPDNLLDCQQLLAEWWEVKSRGRTENAFRRACAFLSEQPPSDRRQILERAVIGGYQGLHPLPPQANRQQHGGGYSPLDTARRATEMISRMQAAMAEDGDNNPTTFFS